MKNETPPAGTPEEEAADPATDETSESAAQQGRCGEGAHSAMKHWQNESKERHRLKRPEH